MTRLPVPGGDEGAWGSILNAFLGVEHNADGTLKRAGEFSAKYSLPTGGIPLSDLSTTVQQKFVYKGDYSASTTYNKGDIVVKSGVAYIYINDSASSGNPPPNLTYWSGSNTNATYSYTPMAATGTVAGSDTGNAEFAGFVVTNPGTSITVYVQDGTNFIAGSSSSPISLTNGLTYTLAQPVKIITGISVTFSATTGSPSINVIWK